jgi:hypothetical protein
VKININDPKYSVNGGSKAKRLRCFWQIEPDTNVGKVLEQMLAVWLHQQDDNNKATTNATYVSAQKAILRLLGKKIMEVKTEDEFLKIDYSKASVSKLPIEASLVPILEVRFQEINTCLVSGAPFAAIMLTGSILEGLLLGCAIKNPQRFNQALASPKDNSGKIRQFQDWTLGNFIDVACEADFLKLDVKKFSHSLRDFRNYIHPYAQMASGFKPDQHTAKICLQVLKAAIADLSGER